MFSLFGQPASRDREAYSLGLVCSFSFCVTVACREVHCHAESLFQE